MRATSLSDAKAIAWRRPAPTDDPSSRNARPADNSTQDTQGIAMR
jgi:hypothetical protein